MSDDLVKRYRLEGQEWRAVQIDGDDMDYSSETEWVRATDHAASLIAKDAEIARLRGIEDRLRGLLQGRHSSLTISFNDEHACNYVTAKVWHDEWGHYSGGTDDHIEWASEDERLKAIRENSVWTVQWYPNTPVCFEMVGASSLQAAFDAAFGENRDG